MADEKGVSVPQNAQSNALSLATHSLAKADGKIAHLNRLIASSANADTTLMTIGYTCSLLHSILGHVDRLRLSTATLALAQKLAASAPSTLLPGETLVATVASSPDSRLIRGQQSAKAASSLISEYRMFMRLWGLPKIWGAASRAIHNPPADPVLRVVACTQILLAATFQYLENSAFLASKGIVRLAPESIVRRFKWSARFWCGYIMVEFIRLGRTKSLANRERQNTVDADLDDEKRDVLAKTDAKWWRDIYINSAWAPVTLHYSASKSYAPDEAIIVLSLLAGALGLKQAWIATAQ